MNIFSKDVTVELNETIIESAFAVVKDQLAQIDENGDENELYERAIDYLDEYNKFNLTELSEDDIYDVDLLKSIIMTHYKLNNDDLIKFYIEFLQKVYLK